MSYRSKLLICKNPKREETSRANRTSSFLLSKNLLARTLLPQTHHYQPSLTSHSLSPNSKWHIVRHNIHKIRSWGEIRRSSINNQPFQDWYLFFQMRRELKRAEEEIRAIQDRKDFTPVHYFYLPIDKLRVRRYNVSHVRSNDGIYYGGLGSEPIVLEYLLYYFSKECVVPYNSIFYSFLCDVSSVLDTNRQRIQRVVVYRRVALIFAIAIYVIILIMFFSLILSVITTTSNLRQMYKNDSDQEIRWEETET